MRHFASLLAFVAMLLFGATARAEVFPISGTTYATVGSPTGETHPFRTAGTLESLGAVTGGGRFIWDADEGIIPNGVLTLTDADGHKVTMRFGGTVTSNGQINTGYEIIGGTGKWLGAFGFGAINGSVGQTAFLTFDGFIEI